MVTADSLHLGGFGDHGGPTPTISLLPGSVALNAGRQSACDLSGADQTGFARQSGAVCDSGAVESDVVPPELPALPSMLVTADSPDGAQVEYSVGALDARGGPIPATCSPESGSLFTVGNTGVFCSATDRAGNTSSPGSFTVHVERATGSLTVELSVDAAGSNFTGGVFTFNADCGVEGGCRDGALTYPYTTPLVFGHIPTGDECIVNETQRPDAPVGFHWGIESTDGSPALIDASGGIVQVHEVLVPDASLTVTSASALGVGASQPVDILGTSFVSGAVITISGITGVSTQFVDSTHLRALIAPAPTNRAIGRHDVTVTNPAPGGAVTCTGCFIVNAKPTITAVTPNSLFQGSGPTDITLTGTGFQSGAQVTDGKITVNSTTVVSPTSTIANVTIDSGTLIGPSALTVTNPDGGKATKAGALTVKERPSISGVTPNSRGQGATATVVVNGNGFASNFVALGGTVSFGPGILVTSVTRNSGKKLSVKISVLKDAVAALRDVTVTNPDGEIGICQGCFTVTAAPAITSLNPSHVNRGTATTPRVTRVTLTGTGFQAGLTVKFPKPAGVSTIAITVSSDTTAVLDVSVTAKASTGPRDITLTNPDGGTSTLAGGLSSTRDVIAMNANEM